MHDCVREVKKQAVERQRHADKRGGQEGRHNHNAPAESLHGGFIEISLNPFRGKPEHDREDQPRNGPLNDKCLQFWRGHGILVSSVEHD
jgi:hypothetical protein